MRCSLSFGLYKCHPMHMCARSQAIEGLIEPHVCIHIYISMHENKEIKSQPKGTKPSLTERERHEN